ncbi:MAG: response regulator transcription factor [Ktedonobacterales bacterium]
MRVYVVAAYPTVRAGLAALVREQAGWSLVGEGSPATLVRATSSETASAPASGTTGTGAAATLPTTPDVVLADLECVTDIDALAAALVALEPRGGIVALTTPTIPGQRGRPRPGEQEMMRTLGDMARVTGESGLAFGALLRDATPDEIVPAITAVASGLITLDRRLAGDLFAASQRVAASAAERPATSDEPLTARELEVLQLMAQGLPNKTIAVRLHISEHTAKFHVSAIMMKLGAASRTEAVTRGARLGLLIL